MEKEYSFSRYQALKKPCGGQFQFKKHFFDLKPRNKGKILDNLGLFYNIHAKSPIGHLKEYLQEKYFSKVPKNHLKSELKTSTPQPISHKIKLGHLSPISSKPKPYKKLPRLYSNRLTLYHSKISNEKMSAGLEIFNISAICELKSNQMLRKMQKKMENPEEHVFCQETQTDDLEGYLKKPISSKFQLKCKNFEGLIERPDICRTPEVIFLPNRPKKAKSIPRIKLFL